VVGVTDADATLISQTRYTPFGEIRSDVGMVTETDYGYTFQRNVDGIGLMDYKARYYSPLLGRFTQPDTVIHAPNNPQSWNRFAYTLNNPIRYTDPSGNRVCDEDDCLEKIKNGTGKNSKPTTVKSLLYGGYQDPEVLIRAYIRAHPSYEPLLDPELVDDRPALSEAARAKMQVETEDTNPVKLLLGSFSVAWNGVMVRGDAYYGQDESGNKGIFADYGGGVAVLPGTSVSVGLFLGSADLESMDSLLGLSTASGVTAKSFGKLGVSIRLNVESDQYIDLPNKTTHPGANISVSLTGSIDKIPTYFYTSLQNTIWIR
jgi:RHS repeat-associated protein